ncbi:uncharacterized protein LOC135845301 [Planococcus citri]|uniref:uncharacterized protein LOC135845301 n=1 Tax=Planococcus citri TaxID=170843 RepID=UPI0031F7A901
MMVKIKEESSPMEECDVTSDNLIMELGESSVVDIEALPSKIRSYLKMDHVEFPAPLLDYWKKETSTLPKLTQSLYIDEETFLDTLLHIILPLRKVWQQFYSEGMKGWQVKQWLPICLSSYLSLKVIAKEYLKEPNGLFFSLFELWPYSEKRFQELLPYKPKDPYPYDEQTFYRPSHARVVKPEMNSILKGILIIHMLDDYFGEKVQKGIIKIMREKYSVDSSEKLWKILSEDGFDVAEFVDSYKVLGADFPVISTHLQNNTDIIFENDASSRYPKFPITVCTMSDSGNKVEKIMIEGAATVLPFKEKGAKWIKVNSSNAGLYALNFNGDLKNICSLPISELEKLNSVDRASVLLNLDFSTIDGLKLATECFGFLKDEKDIIPLATGYRKFLYINRFLYGTQSHKLFLSHIKSLFNVEGDIFDDELNKDDAKRAFHCMMFHIGCFVGSELCLEKAKQILQAWLEDDTSIPVDFLNCAFIYGAKGCTASGEKILEKYLNEEDELKKRLLARALGTLKEADLEMCFTKMILTGKMPPDHVMIFFRACAKVTSFHPAWKFLITSRESLIEQLKMDVFMLIIGEFVPSMYLDEHFAELDDLLSVSNYEEKRCIIETAKKKKAFISEDERLHGQSEYFVAKRAKLDEPAIPGRLPNLEVSKLKETTLWDTLEFFRNLDVTTVSRINAWEIIRTFYQFSFRDRLCIFRPPCWGKTTTLHILKLYYSKVFDKETSEEKKDVIPIDVFKGRRSFLFDEKQLAFFHGAEDETILTEKVNRHKESYVCFHLDLSVVVSSTLSEIEIEITDAVHKTLDTYKSFLSEHVRFKKCIDRSCTETGDHLNILRSALAYLKNKKEFGSADGLLFIDGIDLPLQKLRNTEDREHITKSLESLTTHLVADGYRIICFGVFPKFCREAIGEREWRLGSLDEATLKPVFGLNHVEVMNVNNEDANLAEFAGGYTYPGTKQFSHYCMHLRENNESAFEEFRLRSTSYSVIWERFGKSNDLCKLSLNLLDNGYVFATKKGWPWDRRLPDFLYHSGFVVKTCAGNLPLEVWRNVKNDRENQADPTELVYYIFPNEIMKNSLRNFLCLRAKHEFPESDGELSITEMIQELAKEPITDIPSRICKLYEPTKINSEEDYETQLRAILSAALEDRFNVHCQMRSASRIVDIAVCSKKVAKSRNYIIMNSWYSITSSGPNAKRDRHEAELNDLSEAAVHQVICRKYRGNVEDSGNTIFMGVGISQHGIYCTITTYESCEGCQCDKPEVLCDIFKKTKFERVYGLL